jgi:hypothetical protein
VLDLHHVGTEETQEGARLHLGGRGPGNRAFHNLESLLPPGHPAGEGDRDMTPDHDGQVTGFPAAQTVITIDRTR